MLGTDALMVRAVLERGGVIHLDELLSLGISESSVHRRVAAGGLVRLQPATYGLAGSPPSWELRARAAVIGSRDGVLSMRSSAAWWGLEGSRRSVVDVTVRRGRLPVLAGVHVHRSRDLSDMDLTTFEGLATTTVTRTLIDVAGVVHPYRLRQMADDAVRRELTTWEALADRLAALGRRGRPGVRAMRELLVERVGALGATKSHFERVVLGLLRSSGIADPVPQWRVELAGRVAFLDFAWPDRLVALECDGWDRHGTPTALAQDLDRQNALVLAGWTLLRYSWTTVAEFPDRVVDEVTDALRRAG